MKTKSVFKINDVIMYLAVAVEHMRLMLLIMCLCLVAGLTYYCFARPVYTSRSLIRVDVSEDVMDNSSVFRDGKKQFVKTVLESGMLRERAAKKLGVNVSAKELERNWIKRIEVKHSIEGLQLEVWPYQYSWAKDFPEMLVKEYKDFVEERRVQMMQDAFTSYNSEMDAFKKKAALDTDVKRNFQETNRKFGEVKHIPNELQYIKVRLEKMDFIREKCNSTTDPVVKLTFMNSLPEITKYQDLQPKVGTQISPEDSSTGSDTIVLPRQIVPITQNWQKLDREAHTLEQEIAKKSEKFLPGHPEIRTRLARLKQIGEQLDAEYNNQQRSFNLDYDTLVAQQHELERRLPVYDDLARASEKASQDYELSRQGGAHLAQAMSSIMHKLNGFDVSEGHDRITVDYIGPLEPIKTEPVSPNRMKITGISLVAGIALAIAIPFLIAYLDNSISDVEHAEEQLGLRGLGVVPRVDETAIQNILVSGSNSKPAAKPEYHLLENFRIIRTNLIMHSADSNLPQVILVTSAMPQEGKTMIAANLAMSFASKGEKTILVDGDLRRGRLHRVFGAQNKPGLSDVLSKYNTITDACRPTGNENLTLMTCGKHLNWAAELLDSAGFAKIVQELRSQYQRVIIDSPPVLGLSETSIMQRHADGVMVVIWANHTQVPNVKDAILALQTNGAKFSGFVLNRLDFNAFANRYKYFYYSPRYYSNYKAFEATPSAGIES
ncbi:MAG: polysaccharide biosynthesis tyrosine autokinase [Limisphaerales bacterium]